MSKPQSLQHFTFTDHALFEMARRGIGESDVAEILTHPEQTETIRAGRALYQARLMIGEPPKAYLLRVFVDIDRTPPEVVTVYRTSKIKKYWR